MRSRHPARPSWSVAAAAKRAASTPLGMTVGSSPQPRRTSSATAADTQTRVLGSTTARSWQATSAGVVNVSRWWMVRTQGSAALALMQSWACTTS